MSFFHPPSPLTFSDSVILTLTGLPRSGTAFCSMLFAIHPECVSYHELAAYSPEYKKIIIECEADFVADCNTYGYDDRAQYKADKYIYIDTDPVYSLESSERAFRKNMDLATFKKWHDQGKYWAYVNGAMVIKREEVFTMDGCFKMWELLFGEEDFPEIKIEQLIKLNVQHHNPHIIFGGMDGLL